MQHRNASWLELFFDLIFVVALGKVTHLLASTHNYHLEKNAFLTFLILFIPFWWIWVLHTSFSNRFDSDSRLHRILTLFLMFILIILSTTLGSGITDNYVVFLIAFGLAKATCITLYITDFNKEAGGTISKRVIIGLSVGTIIALLGVFFSYQVAAVLLCLSVIVEIIITQSTFNPKHTAVPIDKEHLVERIGLLAIVLLGESIISLTAGLTKVDWTIVTIITAVVGFLIIAMIWWIYFDSLDSLIESKRDTYGTGIIYSQLLVYMSFSILANTIRHAILDDLNIIDFRIMAITGMLLLYVGKQAAYMINLPEHGKFRVINTIAVLSIAAVSLFFNSPQHILFGMAFSFAVYIGLNYMTQMRLYGNVNF